MKSEPILSAQDITELRLQANQLQGEITSSHKLDSREAGWLPTSAMGSGMDYAESRPYQQGDEPRTINWRLSARSTETYVKNYHMEARPSLCIVLDQRSTMMFGTRTRLKFTQALRLAIVLAFAAEQHRLQLTIMLLNNSSEWLEFNSADSFLAGVNSCKLLQIDDRTVDNRGKIALVLENLNEDIDKGSLVYLISDFRDLDKSHQKQLFQLQANNFVQTMHIVDPAELNIENKGGVALQDMLANALLMLEEDKFSEMKPNHALQQYNDNIKQTLLKSAVHYSLVSTTDEALHSKIMFPLGH
ncbi:MAG: DUF58 domain-containing protein [Cocleimonas sp.]